MTQTPVTGTDFATDVGKKPVPRLGALKTQHGAFRRREREGIEGGDRGKGSGRTMRGKGREKAKRDRGEGRS